MGQIVKEKQPWEMTEEEIARQAEHNRRKMEEWEKGEERRRKFEEQVEQDSQPWSMAPPSAPPKSGQSAKDEVLARLAAQKAKEGGAKLPAPPARAAAKKPAKLKISTTEIYEGRRKAAGK